MRSFLLLLVFIPVTEIAAQDSLHWKNKKSDLFSFHYTAADEQLNQQVIPNIVEGIKKTEEFFDKKFEKEFDVFIFPSRTFLDQQWAKDWKLPGFRSECWMVASGVAKRLDILSPLSWKKEACEHNPSDSNEIREIIIHELVHVFHAQHNPQPGFDGLDSLSWFIEGLATYVSGQLSAHKMEQVRENVKRNGTPSSLIDVWKGKLRYQQAGCLVAFIDKHYGRKKLKDIIEATSNKQILEKLDTREQKLLAEFAEWIVK